MQLQWKIIGWALAILGIAWFMQTQQVSQGASFGVIAGLSATAIGSLKPGGYCDGFCSRGNLQ